MTMPMVMNDWKLIKTLIELGNEEKRQKLWSLGNGTRYYTPEQKFYVLSLIEEYGVRGTARVLQIPVRTIQRWCKECGVTPADCPDWVFEWATRRRMRRRRQEIR